MNFQRRSLSLLFKRRGICIQDSLWNDEREEKKKARVVISSFLSSVFVCVVCLYYCAKRGMCLSVRSNVFLLSRVCFFEDTCAKTKKKSKKLAGEKSITFLISNNAYGNSLSTARWIWSLENWSIMSFDVWECIFFSRQFFALFFCFCTSFLKKKTRAREKTHNDAQKDIIPLFAQ